MFKANYIIKKEYIGLTKEVFNTPSIIIANHQSMFELLIFLGLSSNFVMVVKDWIWKNPLLGAYVRFMGYLTIDDGYENAVGKIKEHLDEGQSVIIFPEGTRTKDGSIKRFHKGAFYLAEKLQVPIQPVLVHGAYEALPRGGMLFSNGHITLKFLPKIMMSDHKFGQTYSEQTKGILKYYREEFEYLNESKQKNGFRKYQLLNNYLYKGPIYENYIKVKVLLEKYYMFFEEIVPKSATIYDIGCGMGMLDYMLWLNDKTRTITGLDYDEEKILLANNTALKNENVNFHYADALEFDYKNADVFILNDMLHYMPDQLKKKLLEKCIAHLNENGSIIIRDGNTELASKHKKTRLTEFFSTNFGFNKTKFELSYLSESFLQQLAMENNLNCKMVQSSKNLSNQVFVLSK